MMAAIQPLDMAWQARGYPHGGVSEEATMVEDLALLQYPVFCRPAPAAPYEAFASWH